MKFMHVISLRGSVIKLIATLFCLMTLASCGGGGGAPGLPSGTATTLSTSAPSTLSLVIGTAKQYTITGGRAPYTVSSSNPSVVATGVSDNNFSITAALTGTANVEIKDAAGTAVSVAVTVTDGSSSTALYTTAPSALTLVVGTAQTYTVSGGLAPYTVNSSNTFVSKADISANKINIAAFSVGTAQIGIFDAAGKSISVSVTVSNGSSATPLFTTAPASVTISNGGTRTYTIGGGLAPYTATSSDTIIATTSVIGSTLSIEGISGGTTSVTVRDAANTIVPISVKVGSSNTFFTTAPSALTIAVGAAPTYTISGGSLNYAASSSNISVATVAVSGTTLTITGVANGLVSISVLDSTGASVTISVTVGSGAPGALYTTAPSAVTLAKSGIANFTIGGGTAPYIVTTSDAGVATASISGTNLTITGGIAGGSAQIQVMDSTGTKVTISVTVGSGASIALFTTASSAITIATGTVQTYTIGGGTAPYTATSSNTSVATTSASGTNLTITSVTAGSASVVIRDSVGGVVTIAVTVSPTASTPLTILPSSSTGSVGDVLNFSISGGSPSYTVTVNNPSIASVTPTSVATSGGTFTATLRNVGSTTVAIVDSQGQTTTFTLTVAANLATLRLSPSALQIAENNVSSIVLNIYGGTAPYSAFTSDLVLSSVSITGTAAAPTLTVAVGSKTNRCITPAAPFGTYDVTLTVVDNLGASATSIMTIKDNGGVAACP